ncbi:MAG TPA: PAS domain-containing protein [Actinomycetota bacterium]|nr:PAS domain-containing protein [Actinomycetota bacterium]
MRPRLRRRWPLAAGLALAALAALALEVALVRTAAHLGEASRRLERLSAARLELGGLDDAVSSARERLRAISGEPVRGSLDLEETDELIGGRVDALLRLSRDDPWLWRRALAVAAPADAYAAALDLLGPLPDGPAIRVAAPALERRLGELEAATERTALEVGREAVRLAARDAADRRAAQRLLVGLGGGILLVGVGVALGLAAAARRRVRSEERRRTEAETARALAEERFRALVEQLPAVIYADRPDGSMVTDYVSPQIERILGVRAEAYLADPGLWERHLHPEDRERVMAAVRRLFAEGRPSPEGIQYRWIRPDGRVVWIEDRSTMIRDRAGRPLLLQGMMLDVTDRKRAEEQLSWTLGRLRELSEQRRLLLRRVVDAQEQERERIARDVHDDPIQKVTALGIRLAHLRGQVATEEGRRALEELERTAQATIASLRRLLFDLRPQALDRDGLAAAVRLLLSKVREEGGPVGAVDDRLVREPEPEARTVAYRVIQEAVANARKHAGASRIEVSLREEAGGFRVRVRDDGRGFCPQEALRGPGALEHLGLSTMRERAETAGGWFRVESAPGRGTTVEFWLPSTVAGPWNGSPGEPAAEGASRGAGPEAEGGPG